MILTDKQKAIAWRVFDSRPHLSAESAVVVFNDVFPLDPHLHLVAAQMRMLFKWMSKARGKNSRVGLAADV